MTVEELRKEFPQLQETVYGKPLVYLDNAASSLRPASVISKIQELSSRFSANIHRSVYYTSSLATQEYEAARLAVQKYLNAGSPAEIILTSGTTDAINLVARSFGEAFVKQGSEILVGVSEHHSNIVPWQQLCQRSGAKLKVVKIEDDRLSLLSLDEQINKNTAIVAIAHVSNILGEVNPVKEMISMAHKRGVPVLIDGAQGIVHERVDVRELDCDFYAFSAHKLYGPTGVGVLYGKKDLLEKMPPFLGGGEMIEDVSFERTTYAPLPMKFEAGTRNFNAVPALKQAVELAEEIHKSEELSRNQKEIKRYVCQEFEKIEGLRMYGRDSEYKIPLFSVCVSGAHHEDLAQLMDKMGVALRSGQMCAEPIMTHFGVTGMLRASFAPYNTMQEAEYFIKSLQKAINMLRQ